MPLVVAFALAAPAAAHAWTVTVHVHGAGAIDETMGRNFADCAVSPSGRSESSVTDCVFGTPSGFYNSLDIVELTEYVPQTAIDRGWAFSKWVDGTASGQINCDPQNATGDHFLTTCKFQIFQNLYVDLYFDDWFANPVDSLTGGPTQGSRTPNTTANFGFNATGDPDSTFECRLDRPAPDADEDWDTCGSPFDKSESYTGLTTNGGYTFSVRSVDPSGNVGGLMSRSWTVDTVAPTVGLSGSPTGGSTTNSTTAAFSLTPSETVASLQCKLDRPGFPGSFGPCGSTANYSNLTADGLYTFSTYAVDTAGNTGPTTARSWTVDATPPDSSISSGPSGPTSSTSASFAFSAPGAASYECQLSPGGSWEPCTSGKSYSSLTPGTYTFSVRGTDAVGNVEGTPATSTFTVDVQPPDTSIDSGPSGETSSNSASFTFSATEPNTSFECKLDAGPWESCASGKTYSSLAPGSHTFYVRGTDQVGNVEASEAARSWTITAPASIPPGGTPSGETPSGVTPDTAGPLAVLSFARQRLARVLRRGLNSSASTTEAGTLVVDVLYRGKKVATSGKRAIAKAGSLKLVAKFTRKGKRALARARSARLTLRLKATDAAGNVTVKKKTVRLRR